MEVDEDLLEARLCNEIKGVKGEKEGVEEALP
jgi:hypothetical protein